jgi:serum/glucocorticoid-regulated kinase 2
MVYGEQELTCIILADCSDISRSCEAVITLFVPGRNRTDVIIGKITIKPSFVDQEIKEEWYPLQSPENLKGKVGEVRIQTCFKISVLIYLTTESQTYGD